MRVHGMHPAQPIFFEHRGHLTNKTPSPSVAHHFSGNHCGYSCGVSHSIIYQIAIVMWIVKKRAIAKLICIPFIRRRNSPPCSVHTFGRSRFLFHHSKGRRAIHLLFEGGTHSIFAAHSECLAAPIRAPVAPSPPPCPPRLPHRSSLPLAWRLHVWPDRSRLPGSPPPIFAP